ncbi:MAG: hypothetical protein P4L98_19840 [Ancalomicrobiaceae bacterium]|nr:hypothetical protein [Ancalomicrobiaceae bacterium]
MDGATVITIIVFGFALMFAVRLYLRKKRREFLIKKYNDISIVDMIMAGQICQGMSEDQLIDSWGHPVAVDRKAYKTKTTETFKYGQTGKNRFRNRVFVEDRVVVGWKKNSN